MAYAMQDTPVFVKANIYCALFLNYLQIPASGLSLYLFKGILARIRLFKGVVHVAFCPAIRYPVWPCRGRLSCIITGETPD